MEDVVKVLEIQFAESAIVQDGIGVVLLLYTRRLIKLPTMQNLLVTKRKLQQRSAMSQRTEDVEDYSTTLFAQKAGVQDGIGVVLQAYTKALTKLLSTLNQHAQPRRSF